MSLGTENLKKAITLGLDLPKKIAEATADKKVTLGEIINFIPVAGEVIGTVRSWNDIKAELNDLDAEEKEELYAYFADKFDLPNEKVELFVEHALMNLISLVTLVQEFKNLKNP